MIGQYVNTGRGRRVTISPAVPGAQYRITAWALSDGKKVYTCMYRGFYKVITIVLLWAKGVTQRSWYGPFGLGLGQGHG